MQRKITPSELKAFHEEGYVILRGAFSKQRIQSLIDAINRLIDRALAGEVEINWIDREKRLPDRIIAMMNPDKYDPAYGEWLDADLIPQLEVFCGGPARHSKFGMLACGGGQPYCQGWHRDLGKPGAPDEETFLKRHHGKYVQFNAPILAHDSFLEIVPRSHIRASTPKEIEVEAAGADGVMPNSMTVELDPGDIAYYNNNLWHRGWNPEGIDRWTMHAFYWSNSYTVLANEYYDRDELATPGHRESMPPKTQLYVQRFLDAYPPTQPPALTEI